MCGIPYRHVVLCICYKREPIEIYVDHYFSIQTYIKAYEEAIRPVPARDLEIEPTQSEIILPPPLKRLPSRPKMNRRREEGEAPLVGLKRSFTVTCAICQQLGHNKRSCQRAAANIRVWCCFILFYLFIKATLVNFDMSKLCRHQELEKATKMVQVVKELS